MNNLKISFSTFCAIILSLNLIAETIYLKVDNNCMDRLEYQINNSTNSDAYIAYRFDLGNNKIAILEVEKESKKWTKEKPTTLLPCGALPINKRLVQKINDGEIKVFMINDNNTQYNLTTVKKAIFYEEVGQTIEFTSKEASFIFSLNNLVAGIDIALPNSEMDVFLEGTITNQCTKGYIVRKAEGYTNKNYKEMTIVPDIGIIEKRAIAGGKGRQRVNTLKLNKINHVDFTQYINEKCTAYQAAIYDRQEVQARPKSYGEEAFYAPKSTQRVNTSPTKTATNAAAPCGVASQEGIHHVRMGETLYSISRRYSVSLAQLRNWNQLGNANLISPCQALYVLPPATVANRTTSKTATTSNQTTTPTPQVMTKPSQTVAWDEKQEYHRVKQGEVLVNLARQYGYTEDRFRWMNGLAAQEPIHPGQLLRTTDCACPKDDEDFENRPHPYDYDTPNAYDNVTTFTDKGIVTLKGTVLYTVRENDTLFSIAKANNTSVERLMALNDLRKGEIILPNQRLYVK